jgi:hypothetical protein
MYNTFAILTTHHRHKLSEFTFRGVAGTVTLCKEGILSVTTLRNPRNSDQVWAEPSQWVLLDLLFRTPRATRLRCGGAP